MKPSKTRRKEARIATSALDLDVARVVARDSHATRCATISDRALDDALDRDVMRDDPGVERSELVEREMRHDATTAAVSADGVEQISAHRPSAKSLEK